MNIDGRRNALFSFVFLLNRFRMMRNDGIYAKACDSVSALYSGVRDWVEGPMFMSDMIATDLL